MKRILSIFLTMIIMMMVTACTAEINISKKDEKIVSTTEILTDEESQKLLSNIEPLPIGTVVKVDGFDETIMIVGHLQFNGDDHSILYDYAGVEYPIGLISYEENYLFNKNSIEKIYYLGFFNEQQEDLADIIGESKQEFYSAN